MKVIGKRTKEKARVMKGFQMETSILGTTQMGSQMEKGFILG